MLQTRNADTILRKKLLLKLSGVDLQKCRMQIVILTIESLASKLMLTDFNTKTNTDFEAPPHILNSGHESKHYEP